MLVMTGGRDTLTRYYHSVQCSVQCTVYTLTRVSLYSQEGHQQELPSLQTGRRHHACGQYHAEQGSLVGTQ